MPRKIVWVELAAADGARARGFWGSLLDLEYQEFGDTGYFTFNGDPGGGIYEGEGAGGGPLVYFGSEDIEADIARTKELGGEAGDRQPIPGMGWFTHCKDSEGNAFGFFQGDESVSAPGM